MRQEHLMPNHLGHFSSLEEKSRPGPKLPVMAVIEEEEETGGSLVSFLELFRDLSNLRV